MEKGTNHIAVIGAGIVGISCACVLRQRGFAVTLIDRDEPCTGTSRGSAGAIATSEILPLASPGILAKAPKWLLDPVGPLSVRPSYLPTLVPWLYRFWRASSMAQVRGSTEALASLMAISMPAAERLFAAGEMSHCLRRVGALHLYETEGEFQRSQWGWVLRQDHGVRFEHLDQAALRDLEPEISPAFTRATFLPDWTLVSDPYDVGRDLATHAMANGVSFVRAAVQGIADESGELSIQLDTGSSVIASQVVLAAGAWSHRLAATWGERIPLETERGYNTTIADPGISLTRQLNFGEHGFVASVLSSGLRIGGAVELGGLDAPPNYRRAEAMLAKAKRFLPNLQIKGGVQWMGYRPSLPDSKPVIGRSRIRPRIIHAFGHGHLGLTQGPATAELVADIASDTAPAIDLSPFRPDRF